MKKLEYPNGITDIFVKDLSIFLFAVEAAANLGLIHQEPSNPELSSLTERVMEAFLVENEITKALLSRVVKKLQKEGKSRLEERISRTIKYGMRNEPWNDRSQSIEIFRLNEPIRFRQSLRNHENFDNLAWQTLEQVTLICRK